MRSYGKHFANTHSFPSSTVASGRPACTKSDNLSPTFSPTVASHTRITMQAEPPSRRHANNAFSATHYITPSATPTHATHNDRQPQTQNLSMCTEWHTRFRRCNHTRLLRWDYCSVLLQRERTPETGLACRKYKRRYRDSQEGWNCYQCMHERGTIDDASGQSKNVVWRWVRRLLHR